jgi:chemotaxis signal transduction protein
VRSVDVSRVVFYTPGCVVPAAPPWLEGLLRVGPQASVPQVSLSALLWPREEAPPPRHAVLVPTPEGLVSFLVDSVEAVSTVARQSIAPPPQAVQHLPGPCLLGVIERGQQAVPVVDLAGLLASPAGADLAAWFRRRADP